MDNIEHQRISDEAKARADMIAPLAAREPVTAGMVGAFVSALIVMFFGVVAGLDADKYGLAYLLTAAVGFAAPYLHYKSQNNRHFTEVAKQYIHLSEEAKRAQRP